MPVLFVIHRAGNNFSCTANGGPRFFVGKRVPYETRIGLYNIFAGSKLEKLNYAAADFDNRFGFWSLFVEPTAVVEGRNFLTLNTYDRAAFTFGFGQFAAHVPDGDFVKYFRSMLALPQAGDYFPHLGVVNGRICKTDVDPPVPIEDGASTKSLMKYLNPTSGEVEDSEVIAAAKLIHWTSRHASAREAQVAQMVATYKGFMKRADTRVGINGRTADICCIIADILHHGRGGSMTWPLIQEALATSNPLANLLKIGEPKWHTRLVGLGNAISQRPAFATKRWNTAAGNFV